MSELLEMAQEMAGDCAWLRVRQASRSLTAIYDAHLRPAGVLSSQLPILVAIAALGGREAGIGDIARALLMDRTTLARSIRPLEKAGFVRVARSPSDGRARILMLMPSGARAVETAFPLWEQAQKVVRESLGAKRTQELLARLRDVAALSAERGDDTEPGTDDRRGAADD
jgi:DNA-binding MarR family transcriptional regulator